MDVETFADVSGAASTFMALGSVGGLALGRGASGGQYLYLLVAVGIVVAISWVLLIRKVRDEEWSFLRAQTSNVFSPHVQAAWVSTGPLISAVACGIIGVFSVSLFLLFIAYGILMALAKTYV